MTSSLLDAEVLRSLGIQETDFLSALLSSSPLAITAVDTNRNVIVWNPAAERIYGWRRDEVMGRPIPAIPPDRVGEFRDFLDKGDIYKRALSWETMRVRKDGSQFPVQISVSGIKDVHGTLIGVMAVSDDISERLRLEDEHSLFQKLFSQTNDGILIVESGSGRIRDANAATCRIFECAGERIIGASFVDFLPLDGPDGDWCGLVTSLRSAEGRLIESRGRRTGATATSIEASLRLVASGGGEYVVAVIRDLSERRQILDAMESMARFPQENPYPVLRIALDGSLLFANAAAREFLETTADESHSDSSIPPLWSRLAREVYETGVCQSLDWTFGERTYAMTFVPVSSKEYVNAYGIDVSDRRRMELNLLHMQREASVGRIAAAVAHQVNNPLFAIKMRMRSLREGLGDAGGEPLHKIESVFQQIERIERTVKALLGFARQRAQPEKQVGMCEVIETVVELFQGTFDSRGIKFHAEIDPDLPALQGDIDRVQEVLINLLENARAILSTDHTVTLKARADAASLTLVVEDDGPGLGDNPERVLEPYYTTRPGGTGLGLAISSRLCALYGGTLTAANRDEGGARFTAVFPFRHHRITPLHAPGATGYEDAHNNR